MACLMAARVTSTRGSPTACLCIEIGRGTPARVVRERIQVRIALPYLSSHLMLRVRASEQRGTAQVPPKTGREIYIIKVEVFMQSYSLVPGLSCHAGRDAS